MAAVSPSGHGRADRSSLRRYPTIYAAHSPRSAEIADWLDDPDPLTTLGFYDPQPDVADDDRPDAHAAAASRALVVRIGRRVYACDVAAVREVVALAHITRIPGAPAYVRGLINVRGAIVTVVDGGELCTDGRARSDSSMSSRLIVDESEARGVGRCSSTASPTFATCGPKEGYTATRRSRARDSASSDITEERMSHTVLVCDDAVFMRTMLSDILQQAGFTVVGEADTGAKAVDEVQGAASRSRHDGHRHARHGRDRCRARDHDVRSGARVVMCSAMGQQALVVDAIQAGAKDFVVKPFQPSRVLEAVQRVLG